MKLFGIFRSLLIVLRYKLKTVNQKPGPGGLDLAFKLLITNWERKVFATIQSAKQLIMSKVCELDKIKQQISRLEEHICIIEEICEREPHRA